MMLYDVYDVYDVYDDYDVYDVLCLKSILGFLLLEHTSVVSQVIVKL